MAGNWIKLRVDLHTDPAVIRLGELLQCDRFQVVGWLYAVWAWADTHADRHGSVTLVTRDCLDSITGRTGFGSAMESVGWLESVTSGNGGIVFPRFDRHMGEGAKERAAAAKRQRNKRDRDAAARRAGEADPTKLVTAASRECHGFSVTREEERREEEKISTPLISGAVPPVTDTPKTEPREKRFTAPTVEEVAAYCRERNNAVDAAKFVDFYAAKGWLIGKNRMKDWRAAVRTWEQNSRPAPAPGPAPTEPRRETPEELVARLRREKAPKPNPEPGEPCTSKLPAPTGTPSGSQPTPAPSG